VRAPRAVWGEGAGVAGALLCPLDAVGAVFRIRWRAAACVHR